MNSLNKITSVVFIFIKVIVVIAPFYLLYLALIKDIVPSGEITYSLDVEKQSSVITPLFPANRLDFASKYQSSGWQKIIKEPVYFEVRLPRKFDTAEVEVEYSNPGKTFIQTGLRTKGDLEWNYDFLPLDNPALNNLSWSYLENDKISLWQKNKKYQNIDQLYSVLPTINNLGVYAYNLERKYLIPGYKPTNKKQTIVRSLRGNHSFYTYIKDEPLDFIFRYNDINRMDGADPWKIVVFDDNGKEIYKMLVADDGKVGRFDGASKILSANLFLNNLPEGVYRVELQAEDEIFFRSIETMQQYVTFINRLYLVDSKEYLDGLTDLKIEPTSVYTTMGRLGFYTAHAAGLQRIGVGTSQSVNVNKTHTDFYITPKQLPVIVFVPQNDVKIFGRGLMALSKETYFNPEVYNLRDFAETPDIDFLLSSYKLPKEENGWLKNKTTFTLNNAEIVNRKLRFVISVPEFNEIERPVFIKKINVTLKGESMSVSKFLSDALKYVKHKSN